ncbi:Proton-dependent oligopeptide transporter family [Macleaya cordata]|uniref:Proton-dependent oligopeptide transporter family n=1 Tax=Macleaya cordata TaxID=56857 RepID=A0A200R7J6_MACCD|nr:Proton-dependent oligopeptide transporter family [Macleaya cordata]
MGEEIAVENEEEKTLLMDASAYDDDDDHDQNQKKKTTHNQISRPNTKGGLKTMPFIIGNEAFEKVATYGIQPNMILYLMNSYHMDNATGTSILLMWSATSNFMPILGAFISDAYLGRYPVIAFGSISSLLGLILFWLTTVIPQAKPSSFCYSSYQICESATVGQLALLFSALGLMSLGCGGIRPCSLAFGADQLDRKDDPRNRRILNSYFNWYYVSVGIATMLAVTVVVYVQEQFGWVVGFGIPAIFMFFSALFFWFGSPLYVKVKASKSLFTRFAQVIVVAFKNRSLEFPPPNNSSGSRYYHSKGSKSVAPTNNLRFLNKACIIREKVDLDGSSTSGSWNICTVDQVEALKSLVKIIPFWSTGIMVAVTIGQNSFQLLQAQTMDRHITSNFEIPAGSFSVFTLITLSLSVVIYDRFVIPQLAKLTGRSNGITPLQRMGVGLIITCMGTVVGALVETRRRRTAIEEGFSDNPAAIVNMSAMWLIPQPCLSGLAEAFFAIGQVEFFYSQLPKSMASIGMALASLGMAIGNFVGSFLIQVVDNMSKGEGKESWVSSNPNKGHYDYYYWLVSVLGLLNFLYFLVCCWAYGPSDQEEGTTAIADDDDEDESFEKVATYGIQPNMILYLMNGYHMDNATGTSILLMWSATSNFMPVLGAFLSDSYLGRYPVIAFGSISSLLGLILLWLTTIIPQATPSSFCYSSSRICESATPGQLALLFLSLGFMSIGCGGIRPCSLAFGADQLDKKLDSPRNRRIINTYFNWYYVSAGFSTMLAITVVVYVQDQFGWAVGFGVPAVLMFLSALFFWLGSPLYVKVKATESLFTGFAQVIVVAFKNRKLGFPPNNSSGSGSESDGWYNHIKGSNLVAPTNSLRFLNKACIIRDPEKDLNLDGSSTSGPWNLCTVDQVEALKSLVKIIPLWSTSIIQAITISPNSLGLLQAKTMNRHITSNFEIPAGSFGVFTIGTLCLWVVIYDRFVVPRLAKLTGRSNGLSPLQRMGVGLIITFIVTVVGALVEGCRRRIAIKEGLSDNPEALVNMSALWLIPQPCLGGLAEAFYAIGQIEFFYAQLPKSMTSIGMALVSLGMAVGNLVASFLIQVVDNMTKGEGKESWVSSNPNKGHYDYYYWLISVLGLLNFLYFLVWNEAFEKVATYGIQPNMILYLMNSYHMDNATGTSILLMWSATSNFMPILGAFISDAYLGRYPVIAFGSISSLLGLILLWLTTIVPQAKPSSFCYSSSQICESATLGQLALLFSSLGFMSIGCGGIRPCSLAFGADQLDRKDGPRNQRILSSYFNWYYVSTGISTMLAITVVVYVQDHFGWVVGFGVPAVFMFFSALFFWLGSPLYVKVKATKSLFTGFAQVIVVAFKNRKLGFPPPNNSSGSKSNEWYHHSKGSKPVPPTHSLRFLNKACIIRDPEINFNLDGSRSTSGPWNLCTVDQVEALKSLVKIIPLWSTSIIQAITISSNSLGLLQAQTMNRHITSNFEIPAGSFGVFTLITLCLWVIIYDRFVVPRLAKLTGRSNGLSPLQRMSVGLIITCIVTVVGALVEGCRRRIAIKEGLSDNPETMVDMSALWLIPQPCLGGLAEAFFAIGQVEFYYSQLPKSMASIGMALASLGMAVGNLVASFLIQVVDHMTKGQGKESWVSSNPNKGHYDYYYWLISVLGLINFLYFLFFYSKTLTFFWPCFDIAIGNEAFEKVATYGIMPNMILYLMNGYHMDNATGTSILLMWSATSNFMPLLGGFLSDAYLGRYPVIAFGSISSLLGLILLWLTTIVPQAKPSSICYSSSQICESATLGQLALLFSSLGFISLGCGGIRPCSLAFGADQLDRKDDPRNRRILNSYFNWYYVSVGISTMLAVTVVVYVQDHFGWAVGFGVPAILMFLSALFFWLGSPLYVKVKATKSLFTGFAQVIVVAFKNRKLGFPPNNSSGSESDECYHHSKGSKSVPPTHSLRFLNKACIIRDHEKNLNLDGSSTSGPCNLCTVDQVEALKSLVKIIPLWSTCIIQAITISPNSLGLLQAQTMDRHITSNFQIPAGSFSVFTLITLSLSVVIYDRFVVPRLAKLTRRSNGISPLQRMGVGLIITCMGTVVGALVESRRRRTAIEEGLSDYPKAIMNMSAMWLIPQPCLSGLAEAFYAIGQVEFYYSQLPKSMASIGMALVSLGMAVGNLVASFLIQVVDNMTKGEGKESWVSSNPNKGHYDYYYWVISVLGLLNFLYFLVCCWAYGPSGQEEGITRIADDDDDDDDDEKCYS